MVLPISALWHSSDSSQWDAALDRYWQFVKPANQALEHELDCLDIDRIAGLDAVGWYNFLRNEYFRWKYTSPNRYATTTKSLAEHEAEGDGLARLHDIKKRLLAIDRADVRAALSTAREIHGLGVAGSSGLLALMYPATFGTVDQFVVKALREVRGLTEAEALAKMNPQSLTITNGVMLIGIMACKAAENNRILGTTKWTPRAIDKILWTYGR